MRVSPSKNILASVKSLKLRAAAGSRVFGSETRFTLAKEHGVFFAELQKKKEEEEKRLDT
jgi:hypothetical protein